MPFSPDVADAITKRFACLYHVKAGAPVDPKLTAQACAEVEHWFGKIPMLVEWHPQTEPYETFDQMCEEIKGGRFRVKDYQGNGYVSPVFGHGYNKMRAVHDYFGHYSGNNPFGTMGELGAYGVHVGMFTPEVMPLIFNEIVLANAHRDMFGPEATEDKLVIFTA